MKERFPSSDRPGGLPRLRIAFVVDRFPALSETFILNQITGLLDLGHDIDIYSSTRERVGVVHDDVLSYRLLERVACPPPAHHYRWDALGALIRHRRGGHRIPLPTALGALGGRLDHPRLRLLPVCLQRFPERDYHIVQCHFAPNGTLGAVLKDLGVIAGKLVTTFHGYDLRQGLESGPRTYRYLRDRGDCFVAISSYNRTGLERLGFPPGRIVDHPVGIDLAKFPFRGGTVEERLHSGPVEVLTVARLVPEKGIEFGLRAVHQLARTERGPRIRYTIIGSGVLELPMRGLAASLGLDPVVHFMGEQDQAEVSRVMRSADIFLLPSTAEVLPVVLMEAQAVGLPVVATDVGSVRDIVEDGRSGVVVPPADTDALVGGLRRLLDHQEAWPAMGRWGRRRVEERYDVGRLNPRLVDIYRALLGANRPPPPAAV